MAETKHQLNNGLRTVLLVGGAGYIGTVLVDHLLRAGYKVRVLDRLIYDNQTVLPIFYHQERFGFRFGDFANPNELSSALEGVTDVVFLAGLVGDPITKKFPEAACEINEVAYDRAFDVLQNKGLDRVVFISTCSNYGLVEGNVPADETSELMPLSAYATAKVKTERRILSLAGKTNYTPTILRFATAFGISPRMRFDLTVSEFTRELYLGHELLVYDPHTWRPYCHVRDFARAIQAVIEAPQDVVAFEVFNAGGDANNFTKQMIVDAICRRIPGTKVRLQDHGADPRNYRVDFAKIRARLGFEPSFSVEDGIDELIGALDQNLFRQIETPPRFFGNFDIDYPGPVADESASVTRL